MKHEKNFPKKFQRKAMSLPQEVVIVMVVLLVLLVVVLIIFGAGTGESLTGIRKCESRGGSCVDSSSCPSIQVISGGYCAKDKVCCLND